MATVRYLVKDVDQALPFYAALGFAEKQRWGSPFAMLQRGDLQLWLSGPGSSASRRLADGSVPTPGGWNRLVIEVQDLSAAMAALRSTELPTALPADLLGRRADLVAQRWRVDATAKAPMADRRRFCCIRNE